MSKNLLHSDVTLIEFFFYTFQNLFTYAINKNRRVNIDNPLLTTGSVALKQDPEIENFIKEINDILNTDLTLAIINKTAIVQSPRLHLLEIIKKVLNFLYDDNYQPKHANKEALRSLRREISNIWESDSKNEIFQSLPIRDDEHTKVQFLPSEIVQIYLLRKTVKIDDVDNSLLNKLGQCIEQNMGAKQFYEIKKNCFPEKKDLEKLLEVAEQRLEFGLTELRSDDAITNIATFKEELKHQLFAALMGSKVITSGYIAAKSGSEAAAGAYLEDAAKIAEIAGAPGAPTVLKLAGALLEYDDKQKVSQRSNNNARTFNTCEKLDKLVKTFANALTLRYTEQVSNITPHHVKLLTRYAIKRVINFIASGSLQLKTGDSDAEIEFMVDQMVNAVSYSNLGHSLQGFGNTFIAHSNNAITDWTVEGLFSCDGIVVFKQTADGKIEKRYYSKPTDSDDFQQPKYGYMVATEQEALHRGMLPIPAGKIPEGKHPAEDRYMKMHSSVNQQTHQDNDRLQRLETMVREQNEIIRD